MAHAMTPSVTEIALAHHVTLPKHEAGKPVPQATEAPGAIGAFFGLWLFVFVAFWAIWVGSMVGPFIVLMLPVIMVFGCAIGPLYAMMHGELDR